MGKVKGHIPIRTCICCRRKGPKDGFLRLVVDGTGQVVIDRRGDSKGRGAYVCKRSDCLEALPKHKQLHRVFRKDRSLTIAPELRTGSLHDTE